MDGTLPEEPGQPALSPCDIESTSETVRTSDQARRHGGGSTGGPCPPLLRPVPAPPKFSVSGDWYWFIPFVGNDVVAKCISKLH